jgi:hypothetical protein
VDDVVDVGVTWRDDGGGGAPSSAALPGGARILTTDYGETEWSQRGERKWKNKKHNN